MKRINDGMQGLRLRSSQSTPVKPPIAHSRSPPNVVGSQVQGGYSEEILRARVIYRENLKSSLLESNR